jgi:nucleoside-diphosphate-sugar epimerase
VTTKTWLIIGADYTGGHLARRLVSDGASPVATRRPASIVAAVAAAAESAGPADGISWLPLELDAPLPSLPPAEIAVLCAPPGAPPGAREARLVAALRGCQRLIYISSTGVYGPAGGQWIDEQHPQRPESDSERARAAAEAHVIEACAAAGLRWTFLRAAGIYGPGRSVLRRLRRGEARVVGDGSAHISRIHVVDLVSAILAAAAREVDGAINCADDDPAPYGQVVDEAAALLGLPSPPRVDPATLTPTARAMLLGNRKIANRRLREELGVDLRYPSWRTAATEELALERAVELLAALPPLPA